MDYRVNLFKNITLKSLNKQTCKDFELILIVDKRTDKSYINNLLKNDCSFKIHILLTDINFKRAEIKKELKKYLLELCSYEETIVMTRLDNDDYILPHFIRNVKSKFINNEIKYVISFSHGYSAFIKENGFDVIIDKYNENQFITFIDKLDNNFVGIYDYCHHTMPFTFKTISIKNIRSWVWIIHKNNILGTKTKNHEHKNPIFFVNSLEELRPFSYIEK